MKTALTLLLLLCYVLSTPVDLSQATITTFAGTGVGGYNGDGPALTTQLDYPGQCVFNADNTIMYCADYSQNRIRAINMATRVITTVGGNGNAASTGVDGDNALTVSILNPWGVAYDTTTNIIYFSEWFGHKVRYIAPDGNIYSLLSSGLWNPGGLSQTNSAILVADASNCLVKSIDKSTKVVTVIAGSVCGYSGDGAAATAGKLTNPQEVEVDNASGDVYIADSGNFCVRKVSGGVISTYAGQCTQSSVTTPVFGEGGPATSAKMSVVYGLQYDSATGRLFISDFSAKAIRMVDSQGIITTIGGGIGKTGGDNGKFIDSSITDTEHILYSSTLDRLYISSIAAIRVVNEPAAVTTTTVAPTTTTTTTTAAPTTTTIPPTCQRFDTTKYGAPQPTYTTATVNGDSVKITVTMSRQTQDNTGLSVRHYIDTKAVGSNQCSAVDQAISSVGKSWVVTSTTPCQTTYTLTQSLADITSNVANSNNNWNNQLEADGRTITYTAQVYSTYSVGTGADCYYVGFTAKVTFRTVLSVTSSQSEFLTADNSAKFKFSGLRITSDNKFQVEGTIVPLIPGSTLNNIVLRKGDQNANGLIIGGNTATCTIPLASYNGNTGCSQLYSVDTSAFGAGVTDLGGVYTTYMDVYEDNAQGTSVVTRASVFLKYSLTYTIPDEAAIVDSTTITTENKLYTNSNYDVIRTYSYNTADSSLFIENKITDSSPVIPTGYRLQMTEGYLCCVDYVTGAFPAGGCKNGVVGTNGVIEAVSLGSETTHPTGVTFTSADVLTNKKSFRLQVTLNQAYTNGNPHNSALKCQVQLFSKLATPLARSLTAAGVASNMDGTFVSTIPFAVEAKQVVSNANVVGASILIMVIVAVVNML